MFEYAISDKMYYATHEAYISTNTAYSVIMNIEQSRDEYEGYSTEYEKSGFCEITGGYWITHIHHHFDGVRGNFERETAIILYRSGNKVVLDDESKYGQVSADGFLNGEKFEIKSVESVGKNNIKSHLNKCNEKGVGLVVLYYPNSDIFSFKRLIEGVIKYNGIKRSRKLRILFIVNGKVHEFRERNKPIT